MDSGIPRAGRTSGPLGGLDVRKESEKIGAYLDSENGYFQPANFVLCNGKVLHATYSSGPSGRLQAQQVPMLVGH